eukprot:TRINITY_DN2204_c0_g1_i10.p1 TRINITY_DN2204_c0_g1~~TRINITY_DN2204_c0_g1_i10.p1  ORF type:complete len:125 (-),score=66.28 TRINITY_DN2204_c0_g1_i10:1609-1983(-)
MELLTKQWYQRRVLFFFFFFFFFFYGNMAAASDDEDQQDEGVDDGEDFDGGDVFDDDAFSPPVASKPAPHAAVCAQAGTSQAAQRLLKDLQSLLSSDPAKLGISATPNEQNIYQWTVKLFGCFI